MKWADGPERRAELIGALGGLPVKAVIALLKDFRPLGMKTRKATRKDAYVQRLAFEWTLQPWLGSC